MTTPHAYVTFFGSFFIAIFLCTSIAYADDVSILSQSGYACSKSLLTQKGKNVDGKKLKNSLLVKISKLQKQLALLKKGKNQSKIKAAQAALSAAKALRLAVTNCLAGKITTTSTSLDPVWTQLSGTYTGTYKDQAYTFLTGDISAVYSLVGTVFTASITLGGQGPQYVFGSNDPVVLSADVNKATFPFVIHGTGTTFGDVALTVNQDGTVVLNSQKQFDATTVLVMTLAGALQNGTQFLGSYQIGAQNQAPAFVGTFVTNK